MQNKRRSTEGDMSPLIATELYFVPFASYCLLCSFICVLFLVFCLLSSVFCFYVDSAREMAWLNSPIPQGFVI